MSPEERESTLQGMGQQLLAADQCCYHAVTGFLTEQAWRANRPVKNDMIKKAQLLIIADSAACLYKPNGDRYDLQDCLREGG